LGCRFLATQQHPHATIIKTIVLQLLVLGWLIANPTYNLTTGAASRSFSATITIGSIFILFMKVEYVRRANK